jgi:hypothetical protein
MWRKSLLLLLLELGSYCWSRLRARQSLKPSSDFNASTIEPKVRALEQLASANETLREELSRVLRQKPPL